MPVVLDVKEMVSTHLAIIASTGAGKSYLASVIIEELMRPNNRAAMLIMDPHGEYGTLQDMPNHPAFAEEADSALARQWARGAAARAVSARRRGSICTIRSRCASRRSTSSDLRYLLPGMTEKQHYFLGQAFEALKDEKKGQPWTPEELKGQGLAGGAAEAMRSTGDDSGNIDGRGPALED